MPAMPKRKAAQTPESPRSSKKTRIADEAGTKATSATPRRSTRTKAEVKYEDSAAYTLVEAHIEKVEIAAPKKSRTEVKSTRKVKETKKAHEPAIVEEIEEVKVNTTKPSGKGQKKAKTVKEAVKEENEQESEADVKKPPKQKRKTKEEKAAEMLPLAARTQGIKMFVGAHVSGAGGVHNSIPNCLHIGGNAFALFLKSQRKWDNPALQDSHRDQFHAHCKTHTYSASEHVLPHGSYLVNLAQAEPDKASQAYASFIDDLHRCESLGIRLYNFHPGNTGAHPRAEAISRIAAALNRAHKATRTVVPVLETMAGGGNAIGSTFEDLRDCIAGVEDKARVGVCMDTCHVFAAGYDVRTAETFRATLDAFDRVVGIKYLKALHLNDSKAPFGSHRDLHQNIGMGFLGLRAFHCVMNEKRFEGLPMVLETPIDRKDANGKPVEDKGVWASEIKLLEGLIGMDAESEEFRKLEKELAAKGEEERKKIQDQVDRKAEKDEKKGKGKGRGKKKKAAESDEEASESE